MALFIGVFLLSLVIIIHEFGHFFAARACGVKVKQFNFGFGPVLFARTKWQTEWTVKLFLMGGSVVMHAEQDGDDHDPQALPSKTLVQRLGISLAGPAINVVTAVLAMTLALMLGLSPVSKLGQMQQTTQTQTSVVDALHASVEKTASFPAELFSRLVNGFDRWSSTIKGSFGNRYIGFPAVGIMVVGDKGPSLLLFLFFFWMLSLLAAVINLLPLPPLDGSRIWSELVQQFVTKPILRIILDRMWKTSFLLVLGIELLLFLIMITNDLYVFIVR